MFSPIRIGAVILAIAILGGAAHLGYSGAGAVSNDLQTTSVRSGSAGGVFIGGSRVK